MTEEERKLRKLLTEYIDSVGGVDRLIAECNIQNFIDKQIAKALIMLHKGEIKVKQHPTNSGEVEFIFPIKEEKL